MEVVLLLSAERDLQDQELTDVDPPRILQDFSRGGLYYACRSTIRYIGQRIDFAKRRKQTHPKERDQDRADPSEDS